LTVASRGGVLLAMKLNIGKMGSKLKWGYATQADVDAGKLTAAQWEASKKALAQTEKIFEKIGGDKSKLKIAILYGKGGKSSLKGGELGLTGIGLGAIVTGAAVTAAVPVIVSIIKALKGAGIMKPDEADSALALMNDPNTLKDLEAGIDDEIKSSGEDGGNSSDSSSKSSSSFFQKNKTALLIGGAIAVGGLAWYMTKKKNSSKSKGGGLSGVKKPKRKPKQITLT